MTSNATRVAAELWFVRVRWPQGPQFSDCGASLHRFQWCASRKTMPFRWCGYHKRFSVQSGTSMQHSNLGCQVWGPCHSSVHDRLEVRLVHEAAP